MKDTYIRLMAPVIPQTTDELLRIIDDKIQQKFETIHLMISSPGGSVFHGLSIYNFLKGAPIEVNTYNFGSVDSIGVIVFCAGKRRYSVPHARFLIHGVKVNFNRNASLDEKELEESFKGLVIDQKNIAKVIADNCNRTTEDIEKDMNERTTLNATEAKAYGLVHEVKSNLFPADADLSVIREPIVMQSPMPLRFTEPNNRIHTKSDDLRYGTDKS